MNHELKEIINQAVINQQKGLKNVLATVVHLEGSSYRKPGVRMLISEDLSSVGAVSGGCVEKEIKHRSKSVFSDNKPKVITYDGRYKLGCEGILYVLIEPFFITDVFLTHFSKANSDRETIHIASFFTDENEAFGNFGSVITFHNKKQFTFSEGFNHQHKKDLIIFSQIVQPSFRLIIIGGEHDAVKLCKVAATLGWEIDVITCIKDSKELKDFPGANSVNGDSAETIQFTNRRERLFNELFEFVPDISDEFLETIYTPAGLHIGAETPEEIAVSIVAEILSVIRKKEPFSLRKLTGKINT